MKHTLTVNQHNTTEHIIYLDRHLPLTLQALPTEVAYQVYHTPILATTTRTLQDQRIHDIRQKNKNIHTPTHLIIIKNTQHNPGLQIKTIQENPQITIHHTTKEKIHQTLHEIIKQNTPPTDKKVTIQENPDKTYTLKHDNTTIKTYKNQEYATHIQQTLTKNPTQTLQEAEYQAQRQYYKHITYDKHNQNYKITLHHQTNTQKTLQHAIQERNTLQKNTEQEEETLCQQKHTNTQPLPPTPWNNPLHHLKREHKYYQTNTQKTLHHNPETTRHLNQKQTRQTHILNIQRPDRNILKNEKSYSIIKTINHKTKRIHTTHDKNEARYIRDKLEQKQYQHTPQEIKEIIQQYTHDKKQYKKQYTPKYKIIDYYKNTTTRLKQTPNTKEQYQQQQITKHH